VTSVAVGVAAELGVYESTLGNWVKQDQIDRGDREVLTSDGCARLREPDTGKLSGRWSLTERGPAQANEGLPGDRVAAVTRKPCVDGRKVKGVTVADACAAAGVSDGADNPGTGTHVLA